MTIKEIERISNQGAREKLKREAGSMFFAARRDLEGLEYCTGDDLTRKIGTVRKAIDEAEELLKAANDII